MLLEDTLKSLRGVLPALMRVDAFVVVVVEGIVQDLERTESRENERNDILAIDNGNLTDREYCVVILQEPATRLLKYLDLSLSDITDIITQVPC